ncbi:hypothetical protein V2A60_008456 [Cordyceps javanica]
MGVARNFISLGAKLMAKDKTKKTALYWAAHHDYQEMTESLIIENAKKMTGSEKKPALTVAAGHGYYAATMLLLNDNEVEGEH